VTAPAVYNDNQRFNAESSLYSAGGISVPRMLGGFAFNIAATPPAGAASTTFGGNTFYTVADTIPAAFPTQWGELVAAPAPSRSSQRSCTRGTFLNGGAAVAGATTLFVSLPLAFLVLVLLL
jgi:hypothetical protein